MSLFEKIRSFLIVFLGKIKALVRKCHINGTIFINAILAVATAILAIATVILANITSDMAKATVNMVELTKKIVGQTEEYYQMDLQQKIMIRLTTDIANQTDPLGRLIVKVQDYYEKKRTSPPQFNINDRIDSNKDSIFPGGNLNLMLIVSVMDVDSTKECFANKGKYSILIPPQETSNNYSFMGPESNKITSLINSFIQKIHDEYKKKYDKVLPDRANLIIYFDKSERCFTRRAYSPPIIIQYK